MGNKGSASSVSPLPSYETAINLLKGHDIQSIKKQFKEISGNADSLNIEIFSKSLPHSTLNSQYLKKYVLPRLFFVIDSKRDGVIDVEEYICAIAVFRSGTFEDKIRMLFAMYEGVISKFAPINIPLATNNTGGGVAPGLISKDGMRRMLVDATIIVQKEDQTLGNSEEWIQNLRSLSEAMVESAFAQFASAPNKIDINDFYNFVKVEGTLQGMIQSLPTYLGESNTPH